MSERALHGAAEEMVRARLAAFGIGLEALPDLPAGRHGLPLGYAMLLPGGQMRVVKVLPRAAPHRRGRQGNLGMHWMLRSDFEDYVALVDLAREIVWLLPSGEFRSRAAPVTGGRWHLDWLVVRAARSRVPDEAEFERYRLERDGGWKLEIGDWRLKDGGTAPASSVQPPPSVKEMTS